MNNFKNLVFEGGGVKGIAYGGAIEELERLEVLKSIKRYAGASAGAIVATVLAVGYSAKETNDIIRTTPFKSFAESGGLWRNTLRFLSKFGWYKSDAFYDWITEIIERKTGSATTTFAELGDSLYIVGVNLSKQKLEIYSQESTPDMQIRDAVRISMSIPFYFASIKDHNSVLVDGGVLKNYPINLFDNIKYLDNPENGIPVSYNDSPGYVFNHETLGFRLGGESEKEYNKQGWRLHPRQVKSIKDFGIALVFILLDTVNKTHLHKNDWNRTIFIDANGISATDFDISTQKVDDLIQSGKKGVQAHFDWRKKAEKRPL